MNPNEFICLEVTIAPAETDACVEILWGLGTIGLEEISQGDKIRIKAFFAGHESQAGLREGFVKASRSAGMSADPAVFRSLSDPGDWIENYKRNFHGFSVGQRFYVHPSWEEGSATRPINLVIDPGHAFGTGTHESTQLCLTMMEETIPEATSFLDVGTGSGILAIAARRLSPRLRIAAFDVDFQAIEMARENITKNLSDRLLLFAGTPEAVKQRFDLVVANLAFGIFQRTAPAVANLAERQLIVSGFTTDQAEIIRDLFLTLPEHPGALALAQTREDNGWVCMKFSRRNQLS